MPTPYFTLDVLGQVQFSRAFNRVPEGFNDFRSIWPAVSDEFYKIETKLFATGGASGASGKWAPLSPAYAKIKEKRYPAGYSAGPLHRTFALRNSLTKTGAGGAIYRAAKDSLIIGSEIPYGIYHMTAGKGRPARRPVDFTDTDRRSVARVIQQGLLKDVAREGFDVAAYDRDKGFGSL